MVINNQNTLQPGSYVLKKEGRDKGAKGLVLALIVNDANNSIVEVLYQGDTVFWPAQFVETIKE
jgi:hypothetical protein